MATRDGGSGVENPERFWSSCRSFGRLSENLVQHKRQQRVTLGTLTSWFRGFGMVLRIRF